MGLYEYMFAVKCGSKYFAGFEWREKAKSAGKLVPIFIDDLEGQAGFYNVMIGSLSEAKELCKALMSKYCVQAEGDWTIAVINNLSSHFADVGTIWSAAD